MQLLFQLKTSLKKMIHKSLYTPGHFYSPIPDISEIRQREHQIFNESPIADINLNADYQLLFLQQSLSHYKDVLAQINQEGARYATSNSFFNETDAIGLLFVLHKFSPKRIVEIGSGFSSALILDHLEKRNDSAVVKFIEPYPDRLNSLLRFDDLKRCSVIQKKVQDVDLSVFQELEAGDILFVDSSHISKVGSDLNFILFNIIPLLKNGVVIHFHDICYPLEYPKEWIYDGIFWNEVYLLRAFLMNNEKYEVLLFNNMLPYFFKEWLDANMPRFKTGGSFYMIKK
jgi:hypothetical protein